MPSFSPADRSRIQSRILEIAHADERVTGGAVVGSGASDAWDAFSDIDITFGVQNGIDLAAVLDEWTAVLDREFTIVHHFDVMSGPRIYRLILFAHGLEMDLSVSPASDFGARTPNFKLLFGTTVELAHVSEPKVNDLMGWGWHHVLHANAAIARDRLWQAEYWISGTRDIVLSLKCLRAGVPTAEARGTHRLSADDVAALGESLVRSMNADELRRALRAVATELATEVRLQTMEPLALLIQAKASGD